MTAMSDEEMEHMVRRYMPEVFPSEFDMLKKRAYDMAAHLIERYIEEDDIKSMAPERQEEVLKGLVAEYPYIQFAYVVNAEGVKITRNITQAVDRAKYAKIDLHEDFSDRDWFTRAAKDRQGIGDGPLLVEDNRRPLHHRLRTDTRRDRRDNGGPGPRHEVRGPDKGRGIRLFLMRGRSKAFR